MLRFEVANGEVSKGFTGHVTLLSRLGDNTKKSFRGALRFEASLFDPGANFALDVTHTARANFNALREETSFFKSNKMTPANGNHVQDLVRLRIRVVMSGLVLLKLTRPL